MKFEEINGTDRSLAKATVNKVEDSAAPELELSAQLDSSETCLDNLIIRDATEQEKEELKIIASEGIINVGTADVQNNFN